MNQQRILTATFVSSLKNTFSCFSLYRYTICELIICCPLVTYPLNLHTPISKMVIGTILDIFCIKCPKISQTTRFGARINGRKECFSKKYSPFTTFFSTNKEKMSLFTCALYITSLTELDSLLFSYIPCNCILGFVIIIMLEFWFNVILARSSHK